MCNRYVNIGVGVFFFGVNEAGFNFFNNGYNFNILS